MSDSDDFYLVLPSNSSMLYAPENTSTCFTTHLSREVRLTGDWSVGLAEIHVPCTMMHLQVDEASFDFSFSTVENEKQVMRIFKQVFFPSGVYHSVEQLAEEINNTADIREHCRLALAPNKKGFYMLERICKCKVAHQLYFKGKISRVFGVAEKKVLAVSERKQHIEFTQPATLSRAIPDQLYVYTDVCVPYTVGDTQSSLLRIVSLDGSKYKFGSNVVRHFAPILYVPLLHHSFQSLIIDIRDQHGDRIPFEYGTLTVTLHFKRNR